MTIYLVGVFIALTVFAVIGVIAGKGVKDTNDYYVAGRRAPVLLIVGSLIASFLSTGAFMGDTGEVYSGFFMGIIIVGVLQASGYVYGANLFGKYIRRAQVNTVPEYFGKRFHSRRLQIMSSVTLMFAVTAYMLSAMQGISTLMMTITGLDYRICVIIAWLSFTVFTVYSGSMGVLLTDTVMFLVFLAAALIGIPYIVRAAGGWETAITALARSTTRPGIISWENNLDYLYPTGIQNLAWAVVYGIVWAIVVMVSPWQTSRYLMAKDEHTVQRSAIWASIGVVTVTTALYFSSAFIYVINPNIDPASTNLIWAAMNVMPVSVGVILLTGILSAGISSASTFLSLIGTSLTNDVLAYKMTSDVKTNLRISRCGMAVVSVIVLLMAYFNPPQIFWIMYFGGTVIASSWGIVAITSVWSKRLSEASAFWGMLLGFSGCVAAKTFSAIVDIALPVFLDPFFVGLVLSIVGMILGSNVTQPTEEIIQEYNKLHVRPTAEKNIQEDKKTANLMYIYLAFGILLGCFFVVFYALPYMRAVS